MAASTWVYDWVGGAIKAHATPQLVPAGLHETPEAVSARNLRTRIVELLALGPRDPEFLTREPPEMLLPPEAFGAVDAFPALGLSALFKSCANWPLATLAMVIAFAEYVGG